MLSTLDVGRSDETRNAGMAAVANSLGQRSRIESVIEESAQKVYCQCWGGRMGEVDDKIRIHSRRRH